MTDGLQSRLDLAQLDSIASAFDLGIRSAEKIDQPVFSNPCQVAGLVNPGVAGPDRGAVEEGGSSQIAILPVTGTETDAADIEIAGDPWADRIEIAVQDEEILAAARPADGNRRGRVLGAARHGVIAARDGRLGRPVEISELHVGQAPHEVNQGRGRQDFAAPKQALEQRKIALADHVEFGEISEHGRHREPLGERTIANKLGQPVGPQVHLRRH